MIVSIREEQIVQEALSIDKVQVPDSPPVRRVEVSLGRDTADEPAAFVVAYLDRSTQESDWTNEKLRPIQHRVRELLREAGIERWAYVRFEPDQELRKAV